MRQGGKSPFAACAFVEVICSGVEHPDVVLVRELYDELGREGLSLPLA